MIEIDKETFYFAMGELLTKTARQLRLDIPAIKRATGLQYTTIKRMLEGEGFMFHQIIPVADCLGLELAAITYYALNHEGPSGKEKTNIDDLI